MEEACCIRGSRFSRPRSAGLDHLDTRSPSIDREHDQGNTMSSSPVAAPSSTPRPARSIPPGSRTSVWRRMWASRAVYLFILPGFLWYVVFHYLPILGNVIAFKDYSIFVGIRDSPWVGLDNFRRIFD